MKEESIWTLLGRIFRGVVLLGFSLWASCIALLAALKNQWTKGIFFLILVIIADKALDKLYKKVRKKEQ